MGAEFQAASAVSKATVFYAETSTDASKWTPGPSAYNCQRKRQEVTMVDHVVTHGHPSVCGRTGRGERRAGEENTEALHGALQEAGVDVAVGQT